jgi:hypothetical protein
MQLEKGRQHNKTYCEIRKMENKTRIQTILIEAIVAVAQGREPIIPTIYNSIATHQMCIGYDQLLIGR